MRRYWVLLLVFVVSAAGPADDVDTLLQKGDSAYEQRDYASAIAFYEQAELRCTEPGRVHFAMASAMFRLAEEGGADRFRLLLDAERRYRNCLSPHEPRRVEALYGLATCLLHKASSRDGVVLEEAVTRLRQCLLEAPPDSELAKRARYNLERAQLLLFQAPSSTTRTNEDKPPEGTEPDGGTGANDPMTSPMVQPQPGPGTDPGQPTGTAATKQETRPKAQPTDAPPPPGEGSLPPVPDRSDAPPLSPEHARTHLKMAVERILEEKQSHREATARPAAPEVPDW